MSWRLTKRQVTFVPETVLGRGEPITGWLVYFRGLADVPCCLHRPPGVWRRRRWLVSEISTGLAICEGPRGSRHDALDAADRLIRHHGGPKGMRRAIAEYRAAH